MFSSKFRSGILAITILMVLSYGSIVFAVPVDNANGISINENINYQALFSSYESAPDVTYTGNGVGVLDVAVGFLDATGVTSIISHGTSNYGVFSRAHGIFVHDGGSVKLNNVSITTSGRTSMGIYVLAPTSGTGSATVTVEGNLNITSIGPGVASPPYNTNEDAINVTQEGASLIVKGDTTIDVLSGSYADAVTSANFGKVTLVGKTTINVSQNTNSHGLNATEGGVIDAGIVDIKNIEVAGTTKANSHGIVAMGWYTTNASKITIQGGSVIHKNPAGTVNPSSGSNSALRATIGGEINVLGDLTILTEGASARAIYASAGASINLNNTDITTTGVTATIQSGRAGTDTAAGVGTVNSIGKLVIKHEDSTTSAIFLQYDGSKVIADYTNSSTIINTAGNAIMFANAVASPTQGMQASFKNATISTSSTTADLIVIGGRTGSASELRFENSNLKAAANGWLIRLQDQVISNFDGTVAAAYGDSQLSAHFSNTKIEGSVTTINSGSSNTDLWIYLENGSSWILTPNNTNAISTFTSMIVRNSTIDASKGNYELVGDIDSLGTIILASSTYKTLTITGNYTTTTSGQGIIKMNTVLGNDSSLTDKVVITGTSNTKTTLDIKNVGGLGDATTLGILVVETGSTTADNFRLGSRLVAGMYDYILQRGDASGSNMNNWYLVSIASLRPEIGGYLANLSMSNSLFVSSLYDRMGEIDYSMPLSADKDGPNVWARYVRGYNTFEDETGRTLTKTTSDVVQVGVDFLKWSIGDKGIVHFGILGGYGVSNGNTSTLIGAPSEAQSGLKGFSAGVYATFYEDKVNKSGMYGDVWVLYTDMNAFVDDSVDVENYKLRGFIASMEGGYSLTVAKEDKYSVVVQPKVQAIWHGVRTADMITSTGVVITTESDYISLNVGGRVYFKQDFGVNSYVRPFAELNWVYNTEPYAISFGGITERQAGTKHIAEMKLGVDLHFGTSTNVWFTGIHQIGSQSYRDTRFIVGVQHCF